MGSGIEESSVAVPVRGLAAGPNPTRGVTNIGYTLPRSGFVECAVYNGAGRRVAELARGRQSAGKQSLRWDAAEAQPGVYVVRLAGADCGSARVVRAE